MSSVIHIHTRSATIIDELDLKKLPQETSNHVALEAPKRLGYYSFYYDDENKSVYCPDKSALRYLDLPDSVSIDCLQGYDPNMKNGYQQSKNKNLLRWIHENEKIVRNYGYDFICNNGVLKDIMTYPSYDHDWNLSAVKMKGKIVLNRVASIEKKEKIDAQSEKDNKSTYAAFNLQHLITKNINRSEFPSGIENDSFFGVFHSKIGSHQILNSGYLDCVESEQELNKPFEEMKFLLVKKYNAPRVSHTSLHANTWWSLAKLAGVDTIVRAKCEQDFMVKNIDRFKVDWLINKHRQSIFVASLNMVLDHVKSIVTEENKCYNFYFSGQDKKLTVEVKMDLVSDSIINING